MNFTTGNIPETWKIWHEKFENFLIATENMENWTQPKLPF